MKSDNFKYDWKLCPHALRGVTYVFKNNTGDKYKFVDRWDVTIKEFDTFNDAIKYAESNIEAVDRNIELSDLTPEVYAVIANFVKSGTLNTEGLTLEEELTIYNSFNKTDYSGDSFSGSCYNGDIAELSIKDYQTLKYIYDIERGMYAEVNGDSNMIYGAGAQLSIF